MKNLKRIAVGCVFAAFSSLSFAQPSFNGDWSNGIIGSDNTTWDTLEAVSPDRFTLVNDAARGTVARVEVRGGDNPFVQGNTIYNPPLICCNGTSRAEAAGMQQVDGSELTEDINSGTQRFAFSVKFDNSWQTISDISPNQSTGAWGIFLQLHGPSTFGTNPTLALSATDQIRLNTRVGDLNVNPIVEHNLANGNLNKGQWIDFVMTVKFAEDDSGFINLQRRDEGQNDFAEVLNLTNTPTLQYDHSVTLPDWDKHFWKYGLYRNDLPFTSVLYLDTITREAVTAAVPEPELISLLVVGLAMVGFAARRDS